MTDLQRFLSRHSGLKSFYEKRYVLPGLDKLFPLHAQGESRWLAENLYWVFNAKTRATKILYADVRSGRLGNNFVSALKAVCCAQYFGFAKLLLRKTSNGFHLTHEYLEEVTAEPRQSLLARNYARDVFFYLDCGEYLRKQPELLESSARILRSAFKLPVTVEPVRPGVLLIHIRAGDIFASGNVGEGYVQPPLCWYKACIRRHLNLFPGGGVHLVYEDRSNPCADGIEAWCREQGIRFSCQSRSVQEDFAALMGAESLVCARGSFSLPVQAMSDTLKYLYDFSFDFLRPGTYVAPEDWNNSPEQLRLMLELPESALCMPEDFDQRIRFRQTDAVQKLFVSQ